MKLRIHPLFVVLCLYFVFTGRALALAGYTVAIVAHEIAHSRAAAWRGYSLGAITLMPYGGVIDGGANYSAADNIFIALAAPVFNALVAVCVVALWWLMPDCYAYTRDICVANVAMCVVNLLPVYPLDGYRVVFSLVKRKQRALRAMRVSGCLIGAVLAALGAATAFFEFNPTLILFGFFLIWGALFRIGDAMIMHLASGNIFDKNFRACVEKRTFCISSDAPLHALVVNLRRDAIALFDIVDGAGRVLFTLDEDDVALICTECELSMPIAAAVAKTYPDIQN